MSTFKWAERYLDMAEAVGSWSKDPSTKCGAVIVRPDKTVASVGFNGFPIGCRDHPAMYGDRHLKLSRIIHAEMNAILFAKENLKGYTIFTHQSPNIGPACDRCAAHIIQSGIDLVWHRGRIDNPAWNDSLERADDMFSEAKVTVMELADEI